jgi:hypothetical protein
MNRFLLTAIVAGSIGGQGTKCADPGGRPPPPVFVVADGTPGWQRQQADRILGELNARLSSPHLLLVARFDAEPVPRNGFAVRKADRDLAMVSPRTPMRDTMEVGFALLRETPSPRTMIVIAQQQFYPTSVPTSFLLESARNSASRIYSIHLASEPDQANGAGRFTRSVRNGFCSVFERVLLRQRAYSAGDTSRLLKLISDSTGGLACVAHDEQSGVACAAAIAGAIEKLSYLED